MTRPSITVRNPATLEHVKDVPVASPTDVAAAAAKARAAQSAWRATSYADRARLLYRFRDVLMDEQEAVADVITAETGKPRAEVYGNELFYMCDVIGFWAKNAERFLKWERIQPHLFMFWSKRVTSAYYPLGVIGIISPWNFPLVLTAGDAVPALMAGNAVIIKPSELTPLTALLVAELAQKSGFPDGLLQTIVGAAETGQALIDHVDMIAFTGSVEAGKLVAHRAAERLIPVSLELGGKDPAIVLKDANLDRAANACVWGALMNSGQVCTSIERVYVEEPAYEAFVAKVVERVRALRQGKSDDEVDIGSMSSKEQFDKVDAQVREAIARGAKPLTGGRANPNFPGLFYEPTVLVNVNQDMAIMKDETFGPVIPIMKVGDASEAVRLANQSRYGLDACLFTRDKNAYTRLIGELEAGTVCVNDGLVNYIIPDTPMGGIKDSGFSRRHGAAGIRKFAQQKTIVVDRVGLKSDFPWFPASRKKTEGLRRLMNLLWRSGWRNKLRRPGSARRSPVP